MMKKWLSIGLIGLMTVSLMAGCADTKAEEAAPAEEVVIEEKAVEEVAAETGIFLTVEGLQAKLASEDVILLDARGEDAYNGGHIPGAYAVAWQSLSTMGVDFATPTWGSVENPQTLATALGNLGVDGSKPVIVYADTEKGWGEDGRIFWTLKMAGIEDVKILDGGINVWNDKDGDITTEATEATPVTFELASLDNSHTIDTASLAADYMSYKVIDTRDLDEYEGAIKFGEARGGHLPGAIHLAYKSLLNNDGTLKNQEDLVTIFEAAGLNKEDKIATYCTAGIRSAHVAVILETLGYDNVVNYDESFYVWANTPELKLGRVVKGTAYNYYTQDDLKQAIEDKASINLVDIQVADEFEAHHIASAIETNAYPVKTEEEQAKLDEAITLAKENGEPVVIVCPRGGGGAQRTADYMLDQGLPSAQLYILEKGQEGWPYDELLANN